MEAVHAQAHRVQAGQPARVNAGHGIGAAGFGAQVDDRDVAVHLNLLAKVVLRGHVHARAAGHGADLSDQLQVAQDGGGLSVQTHQELVQDVQEGFVVGVEVGAGVQHDVRGRDKLGRRAGQGLLQAVKGVDVHGAVAVDDGVVEQRLRGLDLLLHLQGDFGDDAAHARDDAVDVEAAAEDLQVHSVARLGHFL